MIVFERVPFYGAKAVSQHEDVAHRTTMEAGITEAARRALYVLSHRERERMKDLYCKYIPYRASGQAKTYIAPALPHEAYVNQLRGILSEVNTA